VEESEQWLEGTAPADTPFWRPQLEMSLGPRLAQADAAARAALEAAIAEAFGRETKDGRCRLVAHVRVVTGNKAG
jgi:hypothetical protein